MRTRMLAATAVAALGLLVGCSGSSPVASPVQRPQTGSEGVLRQVHSPGKVTDDMHLQPRSCSGPEAQDGEPLPDPNCTPGAVDPAVTPATLKTTICKVGWTATVRPPLADTAHWKRVSEAVYRDPAGFVGEYDHLVPLELGGANSTSNLWPEPGPVPNSKDKVEAAMHRDVCAGRLSLRQAQVQIARDWTTATK